MAAAAASGTRQHLCAGVEEGEEEAEERRLQDGTVAMLSVILHRADAEFFERF